MRKRHIVVLISIVLIGLIFWLTDNLIILPKDSADCLELTEEDERIIINYLNNNMDNNSKNRIQKTYSTFEIIGTDKKKVYLYLSQQSYYVLNGELKTENTWLCPVVLTIKDKNGKISIVKHQVPRDGSEYGKDRRRLFPKNVLNRITAFGSNNNEGPRNLQKILEEMAETDFKKGLMPTRET